MLTLSVMGQVSAHRPSLCQIKSNCGLREYQSPQAGAGASAAAAAAWRRDDGLKAYKTNSPNGPSPAPRAHLIAPATGKTPGPSRSRPRRRGNCGAGAAQIISLFLPGAAAVAPFKVARRRRGEPSRDRYLAVRRAPDGRHSMAGQRLAPPGQFGARTRASCRGGAAEANRPADTSGARPPSLNVFRQQPPPPPPPCARSHAHAARAKINKFSTGRAWRPN